MISILNLIRTGSANTRQEIERQSELSRAIVADRLTTLSELGLVDESELGTASGGRAPRLVRFRADVARVLVATLDQTALGVGIADLGGKMMMEHHEVIDLGAGPDAICKRLIALLEWTLEKHDGNYDAWGIGLSVPGPVPFSNDNELLAHTPAFLPTWEDYPFIETMLGHFQCPVWMRSSVETMAMGELLAGAGADQSGMLFVKVGRRIGAAIGIERTIYRGTQGMAGLIGQTPVETENGAVPLEVAAGSDAIATAGTLAAKNGDSSYLTEILERNGEVTAIDVGQAAQLGDAVCTEILSRSGRLIGQAVAGLTNMLNPAIIVLSGSAAQTNDTLLAAVREAVYRNSHPLVTRDLKIVRSQLGSSAGLSGAAMAVVEAMFENHFLRGWVGHGRVLAHEGVAKAIAEAEARKRAQPKNPEPPAAKWGQ